MSNSSLHFLRDIWSQYQYETPHGVDVSTDELQWLLGVGVIVVGLNYSGSFDTNCMLPHTLTKVDFTEPRDPFTDDVLIHLVQCCPHLECLTLPPSSLVTDAGIQTLTQNCQHMHTLKIPTNHQITDVSIENICLFCPNMRNIDISDCIGLTDSALLALISTFPHLHSFAILTSNHFSENGLLSFADKCHELRSLTVSNHNITSSCLTKLWTANTHLVDLDISHTTLLDEEFIPLIQCTSQLRKLNLFCAFNITDAAIVALAESCPHLSSLNICGIYTLTDVSLTAIGKHSHDLKFVDVSYLDEITDVGIAALGGCPALQQLKANCTGITDDGVIAVASGCSDLRVLNVSQCKYIGFRSVSAISKQCPLISEMNLDNSKVDDICLHCIAEQCRNLIVLDINFTTVSEAAVYEVLSSCRQLRRLCLLGSCPHIAEQLQGQSRFAHITVISTLPVFEISDT